MPGADGKHTPGPWHGSGCRIVYANTCRKTASGDTIRYRKEIAHIQPAKTEETRLANKHLIAAAPELLEALEALIGYCVSCGGSGTANRIGDETELGQSPGSADFVCPACLPARTAIKRARGEDGG